MVLVSYTQLYASIQLTTVLSAQWDFQCWWDNIFILNQGPGITPWTMILQWRHNGCNGISNHQPHDCLLNRLFRRRWKKTSKLHMTGLCEGNSLVTGEFPAQRASNVENASIWWHHHEIWCVFTAHEDARTWKYFLYYWFCEGNPPKTIGFPLQRVNNMKLSCLLCC